ncbi:MAG: MFS transporter [Dysgonamonadaceae bacterium]
MSEQKKLKRVRLAIMLFYFCQGLCFSSWAGRIADIKLSMGLNDAAWGTILLMIPIGQACGMTLSGILVSKVGSNRIYSYSLMGYSLALILCGLSTSQYALIMSLIIFGFFGNFCNISVNTQATIVEAKYQRHIMASFHGGWSFAGFVGAGISLLMTSLEIKPVYHFILICLLNMVCLALNKQYLQEDIKKERIRSRNGEKNSNKPETFLYMIGIIAFFGMASEGSIADWSGIYLIEIVKVAEKYAPLGLFAYMITMASGRFLIDGACERWGQKRVVQTCGICIAVGLGLIVAFPILPVVIPAFMIVGLGTSSIVPVVYSIAGQNTKISTGMALTIVSSISFMGFLMGPPLIGYISHAYNLRFAYALVACLGLCITIFTSRIQIFGKDRLKIKES